MILMMYLDAVLWLIEKRGFEARVISSELIYLVSLSTEHLHFIIT